MSEDDEYVGARALIVGLLMAVPFWLAVYLLWRWLA